MTGLLQRNQTDRSGKQNNSMTGTYWLLISCRILLQGFTLQKPTSIFQIHKNIK